MIFTKLRLRNFGPHRDSLFEDLTPVTCIIGSMGRGKTHILHALELLLTGGVEKTPAIETFVNDEIAEGEDRVAVVEGWFQAAGGEGYIMRSFGIGKRASRKLIWNGSDPITSAAGVQEKLTELFDVGKQSLASTVFLRQGEIRSGLFTTPTQREDLITRIRGVGFMSKIGEACAKERARILANLPDLGPARDQAATNHNRATEVFEAASKALAETLDFRPDIGSLQALQNARSAVDRAQNLTTHAEADLNTAKASFAALLAAEPAVASIDAVVSFVDQLQDKKAALDSALANARSQAQMLEAKQRLQGQIPQLEAQHSELSQELDALRAGKPAERAAAWREAISRRATHDTLVAELQRFQTMVAQSQASLEALGPEPVVQDVTAAISDIEASIRDLEPVMALRNAIVHAGGRDDCTTCPTCSSALSGTALDPERLNETAARYQQHCARRDALRKTMEQERAANTAWHTNVRVRQETLDRATSDMAATRVKLEECALSAEALAQNPAEMQQHAEAAQQQANRITTIEAMLPAAVRSLEQARADLAAIPADLPDSVDTSELEEKVKATSTALQHHRARLTGLQAANNTVTSKQAVWESHRSSWSTAYEEYNKVELTQVARDALRLLQEDTAAAIENLQTKQAARLQAEADLRSARSTIDQTAQQLNALDTEIEKQARRRIVAEKLDRVGNAFGRSGVPTEMAQEAWTMLVALTQSYLRQSGAHFSVRVAADRPMDADFILHKKPEGGYRPMNKMSGGEGMIFAVRFAFAVQQLLVPKLGLLSLDEPSTHLDGEGVKQLGAVLQSLSARLQNAESQVWITDHDPNLIPFCSSVIELRSEDPALPA